MKTYQEILNDVREKNPKIKMKDAQIAASDIFKQQKIAADQSKTFSPPPKINTIPTPDNKVLTPSRHTADTDIGKIALSNEVDAAIQREGVNRHNVLSVARRYDPNFALVISHKVGVNTLVYLDGPCRVPATGFYRIYI